MSISPQASVDDAMALRHLILGYRSSQAISVAARLDLAGRVKAGAREVSEVARECEVDEASLGRLVQMLCRLEVLLEAGEGRFALGRLGTALLGDAPATQRPLAVMTGERWHWQTWGELLHSVKTGQAGFDHLFGINRFEYYAEHAESARIYNEAMAGLTKLESDAVLSSYDFREIKVLVDVGGGNGAMLASVLKNYPEMCGIVFDLPHSATDARRLLKEEGLEDRCQVVSGSFFERVPAGGDAYLIKRTLHNWSDDRAAQILRRIRERSGPDCKLLVAEKVVTSSSSLQIASSNLHMLVMDGACDRSEPQFRSLFEAAGFELTRIIDTPCPIKLCIIEATPR